MVKLDDESIAKKVNGLPGWNVVRADATARLERTFRFDDFIAAMAFTVQVGMAAEKADHHPVIETGWGKVTVTWWSHSLGGLGEKDFEMAAKTSALYGG